MWDPMLRIRLDYGMVQLRLANGRYINKNSDHLHALYKYGIVTFTHWKNTEFQSFSLQYIGYDQ